MQIRIEKNKLINALGKVQSIVEKRNAMPILEHVKVELRMNDVIFTATDMDITVIDKIEIQNSASNISFTVVAHILYDIVRKVYGCEEIVFDLSTLVHGHIKISAGSSKFTLPCLPSDEFPSFEILTDPHCFTLSIEELQFILSQTKHAISTSDTRYYLNGVYLHKTKSDNGNVLLSVVATDMHRLAKADVLLKKSISDIPGIIVPRKTVYEILKLLEGQASADHVGIEITTSKIKIVIGDTVIISKLIDATFPNYGAALPLNNQKKLSVSVKELSRAIDLVTTITESKVKLTKLTLEPGNLTVAVDNQDIDKTSARQDVSVQYQDEKLEMLMNARYILDCLGAIKGEMVEFFFCDEISPILVKEPDNPYCTYVLVPMQFST
ncbi:Beta sliding clamp [Alphaproteobacteria bacterium]